MNEHDLQHQLQLKDRFIDELRSEVTHLNNQVEFLTAQLHALRDRFATTGGNEH